MYIYVVYILRATSFVMKKIRIGYVLKSADVRTLFSRRNSENSLTPTHTCALTKTCSNPRTPMHTCAHMHTPIHARAYPRTSAHTCTLEHAPHKHTHALNLINHMKLHVNRPNTKKTRKGEEEDRKKKEQESAEAISGLKKPL